MEEPLTQGQSLFVTSQILIFLIFSTLFIVVIFRFAFKTKKDEKTRKNSLQDFENRMIDRGFTKRLVVYDFLSDFRKRNLVRSGFTHGWTVGVWFNYKEKLIALRQDINNWKEIDIPFDKIRKVEVVEEGYSKISGGALGYGYVAIGSAKSKDISKGLLIRIITGDISTGTQTYILKLHDPNFLGKISKSSDLYKGIEECVRTIVDEIEYIINRTEQN